MTEKQTRVGVGVFIFKNGKFLIGKRLNSHGDGTWSIPGGHLEFGESFEETARREVEEETGLQIENVRFGAVTNDHFTLEGKHYVTVWMISDHLSGQETIMEPDKLVELRWVDFDTLPDNLFLPWKQFLTSEFLAQAKEELASSLTKPQKFI